MDNMNQQYIEQKLSAQYADMCYESQIEEYLDSQERIDSLEYLENAEIEELRPEYEYIEGMWDEPNPVDENGNVW